MDTTTLSVKVSKNFAKKYRNFCDNHCLQVGKFTEHMLSEIIEDYHFGTKAQKILSTVSGLKTGHSKYFKGSGNK